MIFNMVGGGTGGAGGGATLVVSSPANVSITVSKDDKSYTKNSGSLGSATFKGLASGTWTVEASGNGQTATKTIEITADYAITIAFFSATISITYPATSTCVVTDAGGQTVASDTNATSSTKTWTATVNAAGTYTVTATSTEDLSKTKSTTVSITTEGQLESVELSYEYILFKAGSGIGNGVSLCLAKLDGSVDQRKTITNSDLPYTGDGVYATTDSFGNSNSGVGLSAYGENPIDVSNYDTLYVDMKCTSRYASTYSVTIGVGNDTVKGQDQPGNWAASKAGIYNGSRATHSVDLSEVTGEKYIKIYGYAVVYEVYNWWLE